MTTFKQPIVGIVRCWCQRLSLATLRPFVSWPLPECALAVRRRLSPEHRPTLGEDFFDVLWRASCSREVLSVHSLALRWLCISEADKKRRPRRGFGTGSSPLSSDIRVASRCSCRRSSLPNSLDTLYPARLRDFAELDSGGWLGSCGRGGVASF